MTHAMAGVSERTHLQKFQGLEVPRLPVSNRWNFFFRALACWVLLGAATAAAKNGADVIPSSGPFAGGNTIAITNGNFGAITNVLVGGVAATIQGSGANWVTITVPAIGSSGAQDLVVQTSDSGDTTLFGAYTVHAQGVINDNVPEDRWEEVAGLPIALYAHTVGVLSNALYAMGGNNAITNVYRFDGTNWIEVAGLPSAREYMTADVLDGSLYAVGGRAGGTVTNVYRFNGASWTPVAGLPAARYSMSCGVVGGALYAAGGFGSAVHSNVYRFDGTSWSEVVGLPQARCEQAGAVLNGELYAAGGYGGDFAAKTNLFRFNGTTWSQVVGLPVATYGAGMCDWNGALYHVGGMAAGGIISSNVYRFDGTNWTQIAGLPSARFRFGLGVLGRYLYAVGGEKSGPHTNVYRYPSSGGFGLSPAAGSWTGGYPVVITGTNLCDGGDVTNVTLCGVNVASITSQSSTQIVVVAAQAGGGLLGDVRVFSTSYGETVKSNAFTYLMPQFRLLGTNGAVIVSGDTAQSANGTKFPPLLSGAAWTNTFAITNSGTETLNISGFGNVNPRFEITGLPASVEVGGVSNFTVKFAPTSVGTYNDWLTISNDSPTSAYLLRLYGPCFGVWPNVGPFDGGNAVMIANGYFGDITNVLVDGVAATLVESNGSSLTIILPPATHTGSVSITLQTSDNGDITLANAYTYNPRGWIGTSLSTAILDNTSNGTRPLVNSMGSLTLNNWSAKVISTPEGEPTQLLGIKMSLYNTETAGINTFSVGLYYVDASLNPLGAALVSTNITLNLTTTAAYYDIPLDASSWILQPGTNYALVFKGSTGDVTLSWPIPGGFYPYVTTNGFVFVEGRRTWDAGSSWDANFYDNGLQLLAKTFQSGVEPSSGSWTGGYEVVILGTNLCDGSDVTNVMLNGVSAASIVSQSATQVVVIAGAGTAGLGDVRVFSTSVGETVRSNAFTYLRERQAALVFNPASPQAYLSTNGLSVSGGSGTGVVSYAVNSGPGSIVGSSNLTVTAGTGMVEVVATRAQDDRYFVSSATALVAAARAAQTIVFPTVPRQKETNWVGLAASASSGLPVSFEVVSGPGRLSGETNLSFTSFGRVRVVASQAGDADWLAAPSVTNTVLVGNALVLTDYSGDGGSDLSVYDDTATRWYVRTLGGGVVAWDMQWGYAGVQPVAGDYDGDGAADPAVYHPGTGMWHIRTVAGGVLAWDLRWGYAGAEPVPGDYDGDGQCDLVVYESSRGLWHLLSLNGPAVISNNVDWGFAAAVPVPGDYDGDGRYDLALYDAGKARWYIRKLDGTVLVWGSDWGFAGATAVPGDYDGDGRSDLAVYDEAGGLWYVRNLEGTVLAWGTPHGYAGAVAVPGDYDGDGIFDLGVYGSSVPELYRGLWHIRKVDPDALLWGDLWGGRAAFPVGAEP